MDNKKDEKPDDAHTKEQHPHAPSKAGTRKSGGHKPDAPAAPKAKDEMDKESHAGGDAGPPSGGGGGGEPPNGGPPNDGRPGRGPTPSKSGRFVISQLLSVHPDQKHRAEAAEQFSLKFTRSLASQVDILSDTRAQVEERPGLVRRVLLVEANVAELQAKAPELTSDTVMEPELLRIPATTSLADILNAASAPNAPTPGTGAILPVRLCGPDKSPVPGATVIVQFVNPYTGAHVSAGGISDADGGVDVPFNPWMWVPSLVAVSPAGTYWTAVERNPNPAGTTITLTPLPSDGPFGWWQLLTGEREWSARAGEGIKIGIIDSGVGPHPYLDHVTPIGAFIDGSFLEGLDNGRDVQTHGTHVSGIVAARPDKDSKAYGGVAPGAEVYMARVFTPDGGGNQGDIANAIDVFASQYKVDLINMSLIGAPSAIEHDAVIMAYRAGTVCICAAGNQGSSQIGAPASYPQAVAVSALGLVNTAPPTSMPAGNIPTLPSAFGYGGLFFPTFSNYGGKILAASPGNGIISTYPVKNGVTGAPYVDMSGTSMAAPLLTATLAVKLANTPAFANLSRDAERSMFIVNTLAQSAVPVGLTQAYVGRGLARVG